ncbi:MAG: dienelactone hydrolase family protein [Chloroflexi bacterium]|nr:dienelactone hydrolase family protein [Chloroflexota bacterium]
MAGKMVSFPSNGHSAEGYLALPASGKGPGVIVIQEWWGLVPHIKDVADRFAAAGFAALAPDLYHGKSTKEPDEAGKMMMALKMDEAAKDMAGAYDFLKAHPACTGKVGSVGFCMGGGLSLMIASIRPIDACVDYYGVAEAAQLSGLKAPVLGHYAANDTWASPEAAAKLERGLRDIGKQVEFHMYAGTDHAFFNDSRPEIYNDAAAKLSWDRTLAFFKQHLG